MSNDQNTTIAENAYQEGYDAAMQEVKKIADKHFHSGLMQAAEIANRFNREAEKLNANPQWRQASRQYAIAIRRAIYEDAKKYE